MGIEIGVAMKSLFNRPKRGTRRWPATAVGIVSVVGLIAATFISGAPARAADYEAQYNTYNRPSTIEAGGATWMTWADTSPAGAVHIVDFKQPIPSNDTPVPVPQWTDTASNTYYGTGPTIESSASSGAIVVAYTDLANFQLWLAEPASGGGMTCVTGFGPSAATPYLVSEGKDGNGNLYLVTTNVDNTMSIWTVNVPTPQECSYGAHFSLNHVTDITTDTTWGGPALVVSGYGSSTEPERFWLIWSGTGGTHYINIAEYDQNWNRVGAKITEYDQWTNTDIGGAFKESANQVWFSYCGTNSVPIYQDFTATGFSESAHAVSGTCTNTTYYDSRNKITYWSGGVGVSYDYTDDKMILSWPSGTSVVWTEL